jgi:hypothetical protein
MSFILEFIYIGILKDMYIEKKSPPILGDHLYKNKLNTFLKLSRYQPNSLNAFCPL